MYKINDTTYELTTSGANHYIIGDDKQIDFYPQVKLQSFNNIGNISIRLNISGVDNAEHWVGEDGRLFFEPAGENIYTSFYEIPTYSGCEYGSFEFDITLIEKPATNIIRFSIKTKEFDFFLQAPLTEKEIEDGNIRPENVVNSYAIYLKNHKDNEFKTGKVAHIFRPYAEDADGKRVWCDLNIDENKESLTITIPQDFYETAHYPILVDPTFGNTTAGASTALISSAAAAFFRAAAPANLNVNSIHTYGKQWYVGGSLKAVAWDGTSGSILTNGVGGTATFNNTAAWRTLTYTNVPFCAASTNYCYGYVGSADYYNYYDSSNSYTSYEKSGNNYTTPTSVSITFPETYKFSIYITYTVVVLPEYDQLSYRFRNDDGSETTATWLEDLNTTYSGEAASARLRFLVDHTNTETGERAYTIEYSTDATTWGDLTTVSGAVSNPYLTSDNFDDIVFDIGIWTNIISYDSSGAASSLSEQNNRLEVTQTTGAITNNNTYLRVGQDSISGDYDIQVKIVDVNNTNISSGFCEIGLFAGNVSAYYYSIELYNEQGSEYLDGYENGSWNNITWTWTFPVWFRIKKDGTNLTTYYSPNGTDWTVKKANTGVNDINTRYVGLYWSNMTPTTVNITTVSYLNDFQNNALPAAPLYIKDSTNITNGANTTAQLTAPSGKTTGDFQTGDILDTTGTSDTHTLSDGAYSEFEWSLGFNTEGTYYFRVADLDTYTNSYATYVYEIEAITYNESVSDSFSISGSLNQYIYLPSTLAEQIFIQDNANIQIGDINTSVYDQINAQDNILGILDGINIDVSDQININDIITSAVNINNSVSDQINIQDNTTGAVSINNSVSDQIIINENINPAINIHTSVSDTLHIDDFVSVLSNIYINVSDDIIISDTVNTNITLLGVCSDGFIISDVSNVGSDITNISVSDSFSISDSAGANVTFTLNAADSMTIHDNNSGIINIYTSVSDNINATDNTTAQVHLLASTIDNILIGADLSSTTSILDSVYDTMLINDNTDINISINASVGDSANINDNTDGYAIFNVSVGDNIILQDSADSKVTINYEISDHLTINAFSSSDLDIISNYIVSDVINISDVVNNNVIININVSDKLTISDIGSAINSLSASVSDSFTVTATAAVDLTSLVTYSYIFYGQNRTLIINVDYKQDNIFYGMPINKINSSNGITRCFYGENSNKIIRSVKQ